MTAHPERAATAASGRRGGAWSVAGLRRQRASTSPASRSRLDRVPPGREDAADDHVHRRLPQDVDSLNPFVGILSSSYEVWGVTYDQLIGYSQKDFSPVPELAETWEESADHTTWTYTIRSGVKWSDGQPLTAADAAYTFNRIINGTYEQTNFGSYVANITKADGARRHDPGPHGEQADARS